MKGNNDIVLRGRVVEIKKGLMMARVKVAVGDNIIIVIVTDEALQKLAAGVGDELEVFKETGINPAGHFH